MHIRTIRSLLTLAFTFAIIVGALLIIPARSAYAATATACTNSVIGVQNTPPADGQLKPNRWNYTAYNWHTELQGCNGDGAMLAIVELIAPNGSRFYASAEGPGFYNHADQFVLCPVRTDGRIATCQMVLGVPSQSDDMNLYAPVWGSALGGCPMTVSAEIRIKRRSDGVVLGDGFFPIMHTC